MIYVLQLAPYFVWDSMLPYDVSDELVGVVATCVASVKVAGVSPPGCNLE